MKPVFSVKVKQSGLGTEEVREKQNARSDGPGVEQHNSKTRRDMTRDKQQETRQEWLGIGALVNNKLAQD